MAEKTLRERCIEAGAEAIANDRAEGAVTLAHLDDAKVAFDAVLGVLTEYADEWEQGVSELGAAVQVYGEASRRLLAELGAAVQVYGEASRRLLAVLGGDE